MKKLLIAILLSPLLSVGQNYVHGNYTYKTDQGTVRIFHDSLIIDFKPELSFEIHGWEMNDSPQTGVIIDKSYGKDTNNFFMVTMWDSVIVYSEIVIPPFRFYSKRTRSINIIKL